MATAAQSLPSRSIPLAGVVVGVTLVIASGVGYRALSTKYASIGRATPIPKGTLAHLPLEMGDWSGREVPLDEAIIKATDTDDHLSRAYVRRGGAAAVSVFIGYGVNIRDLMPHRPEVCYGGAGWTTVETHSEEIPLPDGTTLPCQLHRFKRGVLESRQVVVGNYYIVSGEYCGDVSLLRSKAGEFRSEGAYAAQVQVSAAAGLSSDAAVAAVRAFIAEIGPRVQRLLEDAVARSVFEKPLSEPRP